MEQYRILVVDDEEDICEILQYNLTKAGYIVETASSAEEALYKMRNEFHLILLDIMMGGISGLKMAEVLREEYKNNVPIIFISALGQEVDILQGFSKGGDDYISKPFSVKEVIARVKAVLTRSVQLRGNGPDNKGQDFDKKCKEEMEASKDVFEYEKLKIDYKEKRLYIDGEEVILTKKEAEILILLSKSANSLFSRESILQSVWKDESFVLERTVDVHITRLRKKMGKYGECIVNRSGYGYTFMIK